MYLKELPCSFSTLPPDGGSSEDSISKIQGKVTKFIKKWLNLPKCMLYTGICFPPWCSEAPFPPPLPGIGKKSNVDDYSSGVVQRSPCQGMLGTACGPRIHISCNQLPHESPSLLKAARESISQVTGSSKPPSVKLILSKSLHQKHTNYWSTTLDQLQVQSKFKDTVALEPISQSWNRLITGPPAGQLSFLLRAGTDCLPTLLNLCRWRYRVNSSCLLSSPNPTSPHILNGCQEALSQGRYTWRHDSVLNCLVSLVSDCMLTYLVLEPVSIFTSTVMPDLVLTSEDSVTMIEVTIPTNLKEAMQKAKERV